MFTSLRHLQVQGTQAAFTNYVVCLAVVQGIKQATLQLLPVSAALQMVGCLAENCQHSLLQQHQGQQCRSLHQVSSSAVKPQSSCCQCSQTCNGLTCQGIFCYQCTNLICQVLTSVTNVIS
jgi:hypothetical protein